MGLQALYMLSFCYVGENLKLSEKLEIFQMLVALCKECIFSPFHNSMLICSSLC